MPDAISPIGLGPEYAIGLGPEAAIPGVLAPETGAAGPESFGSMLMGSIDALEADLGKAAEQATALATGQAADLTEVVLATERASLELQLAVQVRNKAVEAYQELFRVQI
jgi:flagellar hook-basal body complex protein FliE